MSKSEIRRQFDAIVDFAGINKFLDTPVKRYSSGMYVRLAFAVSAHLDSEILIVDEVLAVGDAAFQAKCIGKMSEVAQGGRTVLFVSHNIAAIQNLCKTGILLRSGQVSLTGRIEDVLHNYMSHSGTGAVHTLADRTDRLGNQKARVEQVEFADVHGNPISSIIPGESFDLLVTCRCTEPIQRLELSFDLETSDGSRLTTLYSGFQSVSFSAQEGVNIFKCRVNGLNLRPDTYPVHIWLGYQGADGEVFDEIQRAATLEIATRDFYGTGKIPERKYGPLMLKYTWSAQETAAV